MNNPAELCIRVNTIKTSKAKLKKDFEKINIATQEVGEYKDGLIVTKKSIYLELKNLKMGCLKYKIFHLSWLHTA